MLTTGEWCNRQQHVALCVKGAENSGSVLGGAGRFGHMTIRLQDLGRFGYSFLRQLGYNSETVDNSATTNSVTKLGQFG